MRVKGLSVVRHKKHKKILEKAKSYRGRRSVCYRTAKDAVRRAEANNFIGRKQRTRNYRKHAIMIINNFCRQYNSKYSSVVKQIGECGISRHNLAKWIIYSVFSQDAADQLNNIKNMLFNNISAEL